MIMAAADLLARNPNPTERGDPRTALEGNLCRCTGYHNIVEGGAQAAAESTEVVGTASQRTLGRPAR